MTTAPAPPSPLGASGLVAYRPQAGRYDELLTPAGTPRSAWAGFLAVYDHLGPGGLEERRLVAERLVASAGAAHLVHDEGPESAWAIDPIPLVLAADDWALLERGVRQRARLLEAVLADLYGPQHLLADGTLPAELLYASPQLLGPCRGIRPVGGRWLVTIGTDVVRDAAGRLVALRDHTDAPVGAGHALLNRSVLARLLPEAYRQAHVSRQEPFFAALRGALAATAPPDRASPRTVVLGPAIDEPEAFSPAFLAAELGYHLAEGGDLVVRDERVWLRALQGLEPVDVVFRRIPGLAADPLELQPTGKVAGLVAAARAGGVGLANALGSGIASNPGLHAHLPHLCQRLLGEALVLGSPTTWWAGEPEEAAHIGAHLGDLVLHDTGVAPMATAFGGDLDAGAEAHWRRLLATAPARVVAQERLTLATAPTLHGRELRPAPTVVRVLGACTPGGWEILPGGFGRTVADDQPVLSQVPGLQKDVWVLEPTGARTYRPSRRPSVPQVDLAASLPSRAAEALFWLGRNAERAEAGARVVTVALRELERRPDLADLAGGALVVGVLAGVRAVTGGAGAPGLDGPVPEVIRQEVAGAVGPRPGALGESLTYFVDTAGAVRQYLSSATWRVVNELDDAHTLLQAERFAPEQFDVTAGLERVQLALAAFAGLAQESMVRGPGWRFLDLGRRVERATLTLGLVEAMLGTEPPPPARQTLCEAVLACCESLVVYRRRYRSDVELDALLELLLADDTNPRAVAFQLDRLREDLALLPPRTGRSRHEQLVEQAATRLAVADLRDVADSRGAGGRLDALVDLVLDLRGPLLGLAAGITELWFAAAAPPHLVHGTVADAPDDRR